MTKEAATWLKDYKKDRAFGQYPPTIDELALSDWACGHISDKLYDELTGKNAVTFRL